MKKSISRSAEGLSTDRDGLRDYLLSFDLWKGAAAAEGVRYLRDAFDRFLLTLDLVPRGPDGGRPRLLELGANPYFMTLLLKRFRPEYDLQLANYFGPHFAGLEHVQEIGSEKYNERHAFAFRHFNVETEAFPYPDASFDVVLCCEIIEHLTVNPVWPLVEMHRILKPGGVVLITTPNVLRLQHILSLLRGRNIHDPYSGYGPYGRHNREYTPAELEELLQGCGYEIIRLVVEEISTHRALLRPIRKLRPAFRDNIFLLARPAGPRREYRPDWLYRSYF